MNVVYDVNSQSNATSVVVNALGLQVGAGVSWTTTTTLETEPLANVVAEVVVYVAEPQPVDSVEVIVLSGVEDDDNDADEDDEDNDSLEE